MGMIVLIVVILITAFILVLRQQAKVEKYKEDAEFNKRHWDNTIMHLAKLNVNYRAAYYINKYWDKILREIYSRYGGRAALAPIEYKGMSKGIHEFSIKVNVRGSIPKPKAYKLGQQEEFNYDEMTFHQESFTLFIPEFTTEQEERFGKALCDMEVKFD